MRARRVRCVYEIEPEKRVLQVWIRKRTIRLAAVDEWHLVRRYELEKIPLASEKLRQGGAGIGDDAPHNAIELRTAMVVRGVGNDLEPLPGIPARQPKLTATDSLARELGRPQLIW